MQEAQVWAMWQMSNSLQYSSFHAMLKPRFPNLCSNLGSMAALNNEMNSTSSEPEGAGQADCRLERVREAGVSK